MKFGSLILSSTDTVDAIDDDNFLLCDAIITNPGQDEITVSYQAIDSDGQCTGPVHRCSLGLEDSFHLTAPPRKHMWLVNSNENDQATGEGGGSLFAIALGIGWAAYELGEMVVRRLKENDRTVIRLRDKPQPDNDETL